MLASLMEFTNYLGRLRDGYVIDSAAWSEAIETLLLLLAPTAPHITEELWERIGRSYSIHNQAFPEWNEALAAEEEITLVVQVNGKVRDRLTVPSTITESEVRQLVLSRERVKAFVDGKQITSFVYVPGRLVNLVAS
jgi:leucyl-tRNA synthetase